MANNENITIKFKADITDLKDGITQSNKEIKLANAQFKAAAAGMDDWSKSSDGIKAKLDQLGKTLTAEKTKLSAYQDQLTRIQEAEQKNVKSAEELRAKYEQAVAVYGKNSAEAKKYQSQLAAVEKEILSNQKAQENLSVTILNQQAKVAKTEKEFNDLQGTLQKVEKAEQEAEKSGRDVVDVLNDMDKEAEETGDGFTIMKGTIADLASSAIQSLVSGFQNLMESTRETRLELGKVETAFTTAGFSAETASNTYKDFYGILGDQGQATEAVNHLAKLAKTEEELATWTNIATGVYATFGSSLPIENLTEAANETAKTGKLTGGLADALNWAGINEEAFQSSLDGCTTEQERQKMIMETLNKTYDEASQKYQNINGDIIESNKAQAELNETMATVSEKVAPITTAIANGFGKILEKIVELVGEENLEQWANDIAGAFDGFINTVLPAIEKGFQWIIDNKDLVAGAIGTIAAAMVATKAYQFGKDIIEMGSAAVNAGKKIAELASKIDLVKVAELARAVATNIVAGAQAALNAVMNANPIGLIITAIGLLVAAFLWLWNNCEEFRNFWIGLWEQLLSFLRPIIDSIVKAFQDAWAFIQKVWDKVKPYFTAIWEGIKKVFSVVATWFSGMFKTAWAAITVVWDAVVNYFKLIWDGIAAVFSVVTSILSGDFSGAWEAIKGIWDKVKGYFQGVWDGIKSVFGSVASWFGDTFEAAINAVKAPINWVIDGINTMIDGLNSLKFDVPDWVPFIGGQTIGFSIPKIPRLAQGGVLKRGQVGLLEGSGAEAVVPLEKNKEWLQKVAVELASSLNGGFNSSNGGNGAASGNTINFYQTNNSPKSLSRLEIYRQTKNALRYAGR